MAHEGSIENCQYPIMRVFKKVSAVIAAAALHSGPGQAAYAVVLQVEAPVRGQPFGLGSSAFSGVANIPGDDSSAPGGFVAHDLIVVGGPNETLPDSPQAQATPLARDAGALAATTRADPRTESLTASAESDRGPANHPLQAPVFAAANDAGVFAAWEPVASAADAMHSVANGGDPSTIGQVFEHGGLRVGAAPDALAAGTGEAGPESGRAGGVLLHLTSLPSPGIGDLGPDAYRFVDFLKAARQRFWQFLPLTRTSVGTGNSPYLSDSAFARNTLLISPELLVRDGWLTQEDIGAGIPDTPGRIDYPAVTAAKNRLFERVWQRYKASPRHQEEFAAFKARNAGWLDDYATFVAIKESLNQEGAWNKWPPKFRMRDPEALLEFSRTHADRIEYLKLLQFIFAQQWAPLKAYANAAGVKLIGDVPIYVGYDSADVWAHREYFHLDPGGEMTHVSGVPPDLFSETGQLWGTPVYNWAALEKNGYRWWMERLRHELDHVDKIRVDHFRGLVAAWHVPAGAPTAMEKDGGRWVEGPGDGFFQAVARAFPGAIIAEDLGVITPDVVDTMRRFGFPGIRVLQFAFGDEEGFKNNPHLPDNHTTDIVVYTGTHDNDTILGWLASILGKREMKNLLAYLGQLGIKVPQEIGEFAWLMVKLAMGSVADTAILPLQDVAGLDARNRMNVPGRPTGHWGWRMTLQTITASIVQRLRNLTILVNRG